MLGNKQLHKYNSDHKMTLLFNGYYQIIQHTVQYEMLPQLT